MDLKKLILLTLLAGSSVLFAAEKRAKNVILFIGDAGGIGTLNVASLYIHEKPQALYIQSMPHHALVDTSAADAWVSDSAAGMTAIITGHKTNNGFLSQASDGVRGKQDGKILKTLLEHAEERGLSTGVITNMNVWDATPGACYAHANDRKSSGEIFVQALKPRFGDGVDILIGKDRKGLLASTEKLGVNLDQALRDKGYTLLANPSELTTASNRVASIYDGDDFDPKPVARHAREILSRNPKGYFLMIEWDMHAGNLVRGLERVRVMDALIRETANEVGDDTLILFAADHSSDVRLRGGKPGESLVSIANASPATPATNDPKAKVRADSAHTGEEILAAARGPGAERVKGFIANTDLFKIMMAAYGWKE